MDFFFFLLRCLFWVKENLHNSNSYRFFQQKQNAIKSSESLAVNQLLFQTVDDSCISIFDEIISAIKGVGLFINYCRTKLLPNFTTLRNFASDTLLTWSNFDEKRLVQFQLTLNDTNSHLAGQYGNRKFFWRWTEEYTRTAIVYRKFNCWTT